MPLTRAFVTISPPVCRSACDMALQQRMRIEPDAVPVHQARDRAALASADRRTEIEHALLPDPLEMRERGDVRVQPVELGKLVLAGMDQDRHSMAERRVGEIRSAGSSKKARLASVSARTSGSPSA